MKKALLIALSLWLSGAAMAQIKLRPDAFPPEPEAPSTKALNMATTIDEMANWDRYPTYETYLAMMERWTNLFPSLCHVDTIGTSIQGRLILSMYIEPQTDDDLYRPEFFYSATMHGDELTGYVMMLRLIDTLLHGYGSNEQYTNLINTTRISINPLSNPDGTYYRGNYSVQGARRNNADNIDLNRNFPDPFSPAKTSIPQENQLMISYLSAHQFRLSANLHGGSEVMNYPWDSFRSNVQAHPAAEWWKVACRRFVDTAQSYDNRHFCDVPEADNGVVAGGDWYVIDGGRQDYVNYYHNCLELTMELSTEKKLSTDQLNNYWHFLQHSLVNYIEEIHNLPNWTGIGDSPRSTSASQLSVYPNPTTDRVTISGHKGSVAELCDIQGRHIASINIPDTPTTLDLSYITPGIYLLRIDGRVLKVVKQ